MFENLKERFTYHIADEVQQQKLEIIRATASGFAQVINEICPDSREKAVAITHLEEVMMWANASIVRNE